MPDDEETPKHYTRQPWWVIFIGGAFMGLVPLLKYGAFSRTIHDTPLPVGMLISALLGTGATVILVARSHIRSVFWSNIVLCLGIFITAVIACIMLL